MKLSVALATFNEQENIARCLDSVKDIADEIVIVDGSSTDKTRDIAKKYQAKIIKTTNKPNFHINKQLALSKAKGDWILQLDADEVVSPKLATEIIQTINLSQSQINQKTISPPKARLFQRHQKNIETRDGKIGTKDPQINAFFVPRLNMFLGRALRYGGSYPDGVIRLVKKDKASFPCKSVHEQISIKGKVAWLENDLIHYDSPTFKKYLQRANRYTSFTASQMKKQQLKINFINTLLYILIRPKITFLKLYFRHKAVLEGFPGFVWSLFSALHFPIAYFKYWEMTKKQN